MTSRVRPCLSSARWLMVGLLVGGCVSAALHAQAVTSNATNAPSGRLSDASDSAAVARGSYREAIDLLRRGDSAAALLRLDNAAHAWPMQPAYANAALMLATRLRDTTELKSAMRLANSISMPLSNSSQEGVRNLALGQSWQHLLKTQDSLRSPLLRSKALHVLADSALFPEGVAVDERSGTLYVSSIFHRNVFRVLPNGSLSPLITEMSGAVGSILGITVDTARNVLWAATIPSPLMQRGSAGDSVSAALLAIRLGDGKLIRRIALPKNVANASPGDIALTSSGDVLVADAQAGVLWWLRSGADSLIGIQHRLFHSLQGIVPSADRNVVWVADYSVGLLRVNLENGSAVRVADIAGQSTVGIDGMVRYGSSFVAVQNGNSPARVLQITLDATGMRVAQQTIIDQHTLATSPTGGTIVGNAFVYIANSLWDGVDATGALPAGAPHPRPILLSLPLNRF